MISFDLHKRLGDHSFHFSTDISRFPTGLFGRSGAGKSTLLHLLAGLIRPDSGKITFGDDVLYCSDSGIHIPAHKRSMAMIHQDGLLFPHMNVEQNLLYGRNRLKRSPEILFDEVVAVLELKGILHQKATSLSGGERQRVALGRAILAEPKLLLCDEPLASVDNRLKWKILPYLVRAIKKFNMPTIYVSHDPREITTISQQLMVVDNGQIIAHGPYSQIIDQTTVYKAFTREHVENTLECQVVATDSTAGITRVQCDDAIFLVPPLDSNVGEMTSLTVGAHDIILALDRPERISTRNCLAGTITRLTDHVGLILVHVNVGCELLVELTPHAVRELQIEVGSTVYVLIKTNSFIAAELD